MPCLQLKMLRLATYGNYQGFKQRGAIWVWQWSMVGVPRSNTRAAEGSSNEVHALSVELFAKTLPESRRPRQQRRPWRRSPPLRRRHCDSTSPIVAWCFGVTTMCSESVAPGARGGAHLRTSSHYLLTATKLNVSWRELYSLYQWLCHG